jgi:hypothetical protein
LKNNNPHFSRRFFSSLPQSACQKARLEAKDRRVALLLCPAKFASLELFAANSL